MFISGAASKPWTTTRGNINSESVAGFTDSIEKEGDVIYLENKTV